jgi:hypothetical protein
MPSSVSSQSTRESPCPAFPRPSASRKVVGERPRRSVVEPERVQPLERIGDH